MNKENTIFLACGLLLGTVFGGLVLGPKISDMRRGNAPVHHAAGSMSAAPADAIMQMTHHQMRELEQHLAANPGDAAAMVALGNLHMDTLQYDRASSYFERSLAIRPDADVQTDLALCYRGMGDVDKALQTLRSIRAANPSHWGALFNEAVVLFVDLRRIDDAAVLLEKLRTMRPDDPDLRRFEEAMAQVRG
jgi:tetratricopeptide (TPR) repeat protein